MAAALTPPVARARWIAKSDRQLQKHRAAASGGARFTAMAAHHSWRSVMRQAHPRPPNRVAVHRRRFLSGSLAVAASLPMLGRSSQAQARQVNVYNWDTYIGETTLEDFTAATGIAVRYDLFASNAELFAKLREGNPGYDVIFPSNDFVERMITAHLLMPLDHALIPNLKNVDPLFTDPVYDPGRAYSAPYFWGTIGIGYRVSEAAPTSWGDLFEGDTYAGRIAWLNSLDTIQAALKYLGSSINTVDPGEIDDAAKLLIAAKPSVKAIAPYTGQDLLIAGEVDVALEYNGDMLQVMEEDDDLSYVVPVEGGILWEDDMCIPAGGPNPENAHAFIDFILDGEVHGAIASFVRYPCPNLAAMPFIAEEDKADPALYPPREVLELCETSVYRGEEQLRLLNEALTRVLAA
jgi:spermidine/putrescine transport system substrate-binding protein